ncbi:MAG TPA: peptidase domain-containing ABC transporter [Stellaceae bacterium]
MQQEYLNFRGRARLPVILQSEAAECGLACLAMTASYFGHRIDIDTLRRRHPVSLKGVTLRSLIEIARHLKLACRPLRIELGHLAKLRLPAILHWDMNHFVVLKAASRKDIVIHDPAAGERRLSLTEASKHLSGVAVETWPLENFAPKDERTRLPLSAFFGRVRGTAHALAQIFALSVVLELCLIAAPFYMQLAMDQVIASGDADLLVMLAVGFGLVTAISAAAKALRSLTTVSLQNTLHFAMGSRLFHHLVRLPLAYFEKRHIGDIMSRFVSLEPIRNIVAEGLITAVIDGLMGIVTLSVIFIYSPLLGAVVGLAFLLYLGVRLALYRQFRDRSEATIRSKAQENSTLIETLRAIQTLKLFNREGERESQWLNRYAAVINAAVRIGRTKILFATLNEGIFGLENIVTIYLAVRMALGGQLSIGMIFAIIAYKQSFMQKAVSLVETALDFRVLELHVERLSDIALSAPEPGHDRPLGYARPILGRIELRNVWFRYAETEPFVLEDVSLTIEPGQLATIMGPSGGGKSTLVKIMLGLLEPTSGEVLIDGLPLSTVGAQAYREQVGAVMQEDQLLSGSIADNICFFDPNYEQERMIACAQLAGVHEEIMAMPMTYNSLIGDMGSSLSGGQKQRVLLARALYRQPKLLFLDEGTAHLDTDKEAEVHCNLRALSMTRINVAHRPGMSAAADCVFWIGRTCELRAQTPAATPKIADRVEPVFVPALEPQPAL